MLWYLIDRILEYRPNEYISGIKCFTRSESFFTDHFHGFPVVPGVLQIEMVAATGGKALKMMNPDSHPMLAKVKQAKFHATIRPGDQCHIKVELKKVRKRYAETFGVVEVNGKKMSEAEIMYTIQSSSLVDPTWKDPIIDEWEKAQI